MFWWIHGCCLITQDAWPVAFTIYEIVRFELSCESLLLHGHHLTSWNRKQYLQYLHFAGLLDLLTRPRSKDFHQQSSWRTIFCQSISKLLFSFHQHNIDLLQLNHFRVISTLSLKTEIMLLLSRWSFKLLLLE